EFCGAEHEGALNGVLKLADVAGPVVVSQTRARLARNPFHLPVTLVADLLNEIICQQWNILASLPERRHGERDDVEAIVEVWTECALTDGFFEVSVGRANQSDINLERACAADALELSLLKHAQQFGLQERGHLADFIQKERAAVGHFELAFLLHERSRERAFLVSE